MKKLVVTLSVLLFLTASCGSSKCRGSGTNSANIELIEDINC